LEEYVRTEAARLWQAPEPYKGPLKITVVYYHEPHAVSIDHDNMIKPIQDALAVLVYKNDCQITDAQTRRPTLTGDSGFAASHPSRLGLSALVRNLFISEQEEAPNQEELL
jgi:hypothetical protein